MMILNPTHAYAENPAQTGKRTGFRIIIPLTVII